MINWPSKASDEVADYAFDWSELLETGETITSSAVTVSGVTEDSDTIDGALLRVWLSGGTDGTIATVDASINTSGGRTFSETAVIKIGVDEPVSLDQAKAYLRVLTSDEDSKINAMIPRARKWVEDHTGLAIVKRQFTERLRPVRFGRMHLSYGPLVSVDSVDYVDPAGTTQSYTPTAYPPSTDIYPTDLGSWPVIGRYGAFDVTYTAGDTSPDERLIGAMLALIAGEFDTGQAYPDAAIQAATNCCAYLKSVVV